MPESTPFTRRTAFSALRLAGVASVYALLGQLALRYFAAENQFGILWPASGWALAALMLGGRRYAIAVLAGSFLATLLGGYPIWISWLIACGATLEALAASWLLNRHQNFDLRMLSMRDYWSLLLKAGVAAASISALIGITALTMTRSLTTEAYLQNLLLWWWGDALGIMLVTPLVLTWRHTRLQWSGHKLWLEGAVILGVAFVVGQILFLGWLPMLGTVIYQGYWMFMLVAWSAFRLGSSGVTALLCMTAAQYMLGIHYGVDTWIHRGPSDLLNGLLYVATLSVVGMSLAIHFSRHRRTDANLRIAVIAFEGQEGMIVTDPNWNILRINRSFTRILGYSEDEVVGKSIATIRGDQQPPSFYEMVREITLKNGTWQGEMWHRRKNGEVFPQWVTNTSVKDDDGRITHIVVAHTDITHQKQQEAKRQADEAAHRDALVREVHHRIKNNLQGITGILHLFAQTYPETVEPINQAIGQVRSIAVIHGLQGRTSLQTVRLCELTSEIAIDVAALWHAAIHVDIPPNWVPGILAETEAVPVALVLNELMINAIKHGGKSGGHVEIKLRKGSTPETIQVCITNAGRWESRLNPHNSSHTGLQLVDALLPRNGAQILKEQQNNSVTVRLVLEPPVITLESEVLA